MIEIKVEEYCHGCPHFKPISDFHTFVGGTNAFDIYKRTHTVVTCANAELCKNLLTYLENEQKEGKL